MLAVQADRVCPGDRSSHFSKQSLRDSARYDHAAPEQVGMSGPQATAQDASDLRSRIGMRSRRGDLDLAARHDGGQRHSLAQRHGLRQSHTALCRTLGRGSAPSLLPRLACADCSTTFSSSTEFCGWGSPASGRYASKLLRRKRVSSSRLQSWQSMLPRKLASWFTRAWNALQDMSSLADFFFGM
ncbi:unnamed protein product [Prorocentrum cordatum]|uniref:Uncharacterized protein n=1 Tax=Prorocentrum cordatum TaxID=2364126 RepID=A0ABN9U1F4_9DINO|nr:unnamed protein product [Polarella glacialis]